MLHLVTEETAMNKCVVGKNTNNSVPFIIPKIELSQIPTYSNNDKNQSLQKRMKKIEKTLLNQFSGIARGYARLLTSNCNHSIKIKLIFSQNIHICVLNLLDLILEQ